MSRGWTYLRQARQLVHRVGGLLRVLRVQKSAVEPKRLDVLLMGNEGFVAVCVPDKPVTVT